MPVRCHGRSCDRVATHEGRQYVQPEPDVFVTGQVPAREVVAAVLGHHRDRRLEP